MAVKTDKELKIVWVDVVSKKDADVIVDSTTTGNTDAFYIVPPRMTTEGEYETYGYIMRNGVKVVEGIAVDAMQKMLNAKYTKPSTGIPTGDIANGAVTADKIADGVIPDVSGFATAERVSTLATNLTNLEQDVYDKDLAIWGEFSDYLPLEGGTMRGDLAVPTLLSAFADAKYTQCGIVIVPVVTASNLSMSYGSDYDTFFKQLVKWICANYADIYNTIFIGVGVPNYRVMYNLYINATSDLDENGLPKGCMGFIKSNDGNLMSFKYFSGSYDFSYEDGSLQSGLLSVGKDRLTDNYTGLVGINNSYHKFVVSEYDDTAGEWVEIFNSETAADWVKDIIIKGGMTTLVDCTKGRTVKISISSDLSYYIYALGLAFSTGGTEIEYECSNGASGSVVSWGNWVSTNFFHQDATNTIEYLLNTTNINTPISIGGFRVVTNATEAIFAGKASEAHLADKATTADSLQGYPYQNILERHKSGSLWCSTAGWYRIGECVIPNSDGNTFLLSITRQYASGGAPESYLFAVAETYRGKYSITQIAGAYNVQLIKKIRIDYVNVQKSYIDFYYEYDGGNTIYWTTIGSATSYTTAQYNPTLQGTSYEFNIGEGCISDKGFSAPKFVTDGGTSAQFVRGDGTLGNLSEMNNTQEVNYIGAVTGRIQIEISPNIMNVVDVNGADEICFHLIAPIEDYVREYDILARRSDIGTPTFTFNGDTTDGSNSTIMVEAGDELVYEGSGIYSTDSVCDVMFNIKSFDGGSTYYVRCSKFER